jgi:hypothetical protein
MRKERHVENSDEHCEIILKTVTPETNAGGRVWTGLSRLKTAVLKFFG